MSSTVKVFFQAAAVGVEDAGRLVGMQSFPVNKGTELLRTVSQTFKEKQFQCDSNMKFHDVETSELPFAKFVKAQDASYSNATIIEYAGNYYLSPINYNNAVERLATCNGVAADLRIG